MWNQNSKRLVRKSFFGLWIAIQTSQISITAAASRLYLKFKYLIYDENVLSGFIIFLIVIETPHTDKRFVSPYRYTIIKIILQEFVDIHYLINIHRSCYKHPVQDNLLQMPNCAMGKTIIQMVSYKRVPAPARKIVHSS